MNKIQISGGRPLYGDIEIGGMKNAALPIIFATILAGDVCTIENLPLISDVVTSLEILESLGARVTHLKKGTVRIDTTGLPYTVPDFDLVRKLPRFHLHRRRTTRQIRTNRSRTSRRL